MNMTPEEHYEHAKKFLLDTFAKTTKVYSVLRSVSRSGNSRKIDFYAFVNDPKYGILKVWLTPNIGYFLNNGKRPAKGWDNGLTVGGSGMDMGYHVVNTVSALLYRNEDGTYSHDGAYKLTHDWI